MKSESAKHTLGPWSAIALPIQCETGSPFLIIKDTYIEIRGGQGFLDYADPLAGFCVTGYIDPANAKLMAAAPDLLESLQEFVALANFDADTSPKTNEEWDAMVAKAESALRRALGED